MIKKYCWAWDRVYVKSNGRIPCWCDSGEKYTIVHKDLKSHNFIDEIVNGPEMRAMRIRVIEEQKHYVKSCADCCCMIQSDRGMFFRHNNEKANIDSKIEAALKHLEHTAKTRNWEYGSISHISEVQVESSLPCTLKCPGCLHGIMKKPLSTEEKPHLLELPAFKRMMDSINYDNVRIGALTFVGRGEPTLNSSFPEMLKYARTALPKTFMEMDTNGNQPYKEEYSNLNWINCSIDGSDEESYGTYRRNGNFQKAVKFMRDAAKESGQLGKVRWKYILFNTNDSESQILQCLRTAKELNIDQVRFIITHMGANDKSVLPSSKKLPEIDKLLKSQAIFTNAEVRYSS